MAYVAHPCTASMAMAHSLKNISFRIVGDHHCKFDSIHSPLNDGLSSRKDWLVFTTIRNHWDAMISYCFHLHTGKTYDAGFTVETFKRVFKRYKYITEDRMYSWHSDQADVILRFETIKEDFDRVLSMRGLKGKLAEKNVSRFRAKRPYHEFYTEESKDFVWKKFRDEIERFGYEF